MSIFIFESHNLSSMLESNKLFRKTEPPTMLLTSPQYGHIALTPINSEDLPGPILPGSNTFFHENDFGTILIHQYNAENFSLRFGIFNLIKKESFFLRTRDLLQNLHHYFLFQLSQGIKDAVRCISTRCSIVVTFLFLFITGANSLAIFLTT
jgi:hypothetical protein